MKRAVFFLVLLALSVRLLGIHYGLFQNLKICPDTFPFIQSAVALSARNYQPLTWRWFYSPVWIYELSVVFVIYRLFIKIIGIFSPALFTYLLSKSTLAWYLLAQVISAFTGTAIVYVTYRAGRTLFGFRVGWLAALFMAVNFIHIYWSHVGMNDIPMNLFLVLTFWFSCLILKKGQFRYYLAAGISAGLTVATKVNGLPVVLVILIAHFGRLAKFRPAFLLEGSKKLLAALAILVIVYFALCPYLVTNPQKVYKIFQNVYSQQVSRPPEKMTGQNYFLTGAFGYLEIFILNTGWPLSIFYFFSLAVMVARSFHLRARAALLVVFPLVYCGVIFPGQFLWDKHLMPVFPFLSVAAGATLIYLEIWLKRIWPNFSRRGRKAVMVIILAVLLLPGFYKVGQFLYVLFQEDTRITANRWLVKNLPEKSKIYMNVPLKYDRTIFSKFNIKMFSKNNTQFIPPSKNCYVLVRQRYQSSLFGPPKLMDNELLRFLSTRARLIQKFEKPAFRWINPIILIYKIEPEN